MKTLTLASLLALLALLPSAYAGDEEDDGVGELMDEAGKPVSASLVDLNKKAMALIDGANADIAFLRKNGVNCTENVGNLESHMLKPRADDLAKFKAKLTAAFGKYVASSGSCARPDKATLGASQSAAEEVSTAIEELIALTKTKSVKLFFMTPDQAMMEGLRAPKSESEAKKYPNCKVTKKGDLYSTVELKTYFAMKAKFVNLRRAVNSMGLEADQVGRGKGNAVCVK
jgi:hypothetical protein